MDTKDGELSKLTCKQSKHNLERALPKDRISSSLKPRVHVLGNDHLFKYWSYDMCDAIFVKSSMNVILYFVVERMP